MINQSLRYSDLYVHIICIKHVALKMMGDFNLNTSELLWDQETGRKVSRY